jgi:hypothetical protein
MRAAQAVFFRAQELNPSPNARVHTAKATLGWPGEVQQYGANAASEPFRSAKWRAPTGHTPSAGLSARPPWSIVGRT